MSVKFFTPSRRAFLGGASAACAAAALPLPALAANKISLGAFEVTTFFDGHIVLPSANEALNADAQKLKDAMATAGHTGETFPSPVNVTLIKTPDDLILVDMGSGPRFVPTAGRLEDALSDADIDPANITKVILTHAHPDHLWGAVNDFDDLTFPEATYYVAEKEFAFWTAPDVIDKLSEDRKFFAVGAQARFAAIEERIKFIKEDDEIVSGIGIIETNGHTKGHISVELNASNGSLVVIGDALRHPVISFEHPDWQPSNDEFPDVAVATRKRLLSRLHAAKAKIIGYHLPPPGMGMVVKKGDGYRYEALG